MRDLDERNNPLDAWLLTNVPVPLPVDEVISFEDLRPRAQDRILAKLGKGVPENSLDAARAQNPGADETTIARKGATLRQRISDERERFGCDWQPPAIIVPHDYRKAASGAHVDRVWINPLACTDPTAFVEGFAGPLARGPETAPSAAPRSHISKCPSGRFASSLSWLACGRETLLNPLDSL